MFGDLSTIGSSLGEPGDDLRDVAGRRHQLTLAAAPPASYTAGAIIQIGIGATAEVVIIGSTAASNVVNFASQPRRRRLSRAVHPHRADRAHLRDAVHSQVGRTQFAARLRRGLRSAAADAYALRCHQYR